MTKFLGLGIGRDGCRHSHAKSLPRERVRCLPMRAPSCRFLDCGRAARVSGYRGGSATRHAVRGNDRSVSSRRPANSMPLVRTVVGAAAAHAARILPMSRSRNGSPPVTKISLTPSSAASVAIRRTRSTPSARAAPLAKSARSSIRNAGCSRNWCRARGGSLPGDQRQLRAPLRSGSPNECSLLRSWCRSTCCE
jgi:hypothetical protein